MKALLLSAYAAQSHVHWQRSLVSMSSHWQWRELSLPPRYFSWRVRGNPLYWSQVERAALEAPCDLLSTAAHEFQGLAVLEAVASGCLPVVPDRLAYPEIFPARFRYRSLPGQPGDEASAAASLVQDLAAGLRCGDVAAPDVSAYSSAVLRPRYLALMAQLADLPGGPAGIANQGQCQ